jgi:galactose mutarotase-like enzyme
MVSPPEQGITLNGADLQVIVLPDRGAEITSIVDRRTGIDLLFRPPWTGDVDIPADEPRNTRTDWHAHYRGGWNLLLPNAGDEREVDGVLWPFHGEASRVAWSVDASRDAVGTVALDTSLTLVPLDLRRTLAIDGSRLTVTTDASNVGREPVEVYWQEHPAYGAPLIGPAARIETGARTFLADQSAPGDDLTPGSAHPWPTARTRSGDALDLRELPGAGQSRAMLGTLTDFDRPYATIVNPDVDLGMSFEWDPGVHPHAWFWQELAASDAFPWYRRAYVMAIEPSTTIPGSGTVDGHARGVGLTLAPGETRTATVRLTTFPSTVDRPCV